MTLARKLKRRQQARARAVRRNPGLAVRLVEGVKRERGALLNGKPLNFSRYIKLRDSKA